MNQLRAETAVKLAPSAYSTAVLKTLEDSGARAIFKDSISAKPGVQNPVTSRPGSYKD